MARRTIVWHQAIGEDRPWLNYRDPGWKIDGPPAHDATLEQLADLCDNQAEQINAHDYVGTHRLLAAVLYRHVGRETATAILRDIAELGGLHAMNGVCGEPDAYGELGVPEPWKEWDLSDATR
jgi:hypothetical protein